MKYKDQNCDNCFISKASVFSVLTEDEKEILRRNHSCSFYKKGEVIYKEGDKPTGLICLSEGKVKYLKKVLVVENKL